MSRLGDFEHIRLKQCLKYWLPGCLKAWLAIGQPLHWRLSAADRGDSQVLSMDGVETEKLIPDLYALDASRPDSKVNETISFHRFSSEWLARSPV